MMWVCELFAFVRRMWAYLVLLYTLPPDSRHIHLPSKSTFAKEIDEFTGSDNQVESQMTAKETRGCTETGGDDI